MKQLFLLGTFFFSLHILVAQNILEQSVKINQNEQQYKETLDHYLSHKEAIISNIAYNGYTEVPEEGWEMLENFRKFLDDPFQPGLKPIDLDQINPLINTITSILKNIQGEKTYESTNKSLFEDDFFGSKKIDFGFLTATANAELPVSSGLNFSTRFIDGISTMIVNKVKTELSVSFYEKMKGKFEEDYVYSINGNPVKFNLSYLLNNTFTLIDTKQTFEVPAFGSTWISAFQKDLYQLPFSMMDVFKKNPHFMNDSLGRYASVIYDGLNQLYNGYSMEYTVDLLHTNYDAIDNYNIDYQIALLKLILENSPKTDTEETENFKLTNYSKLNAKGKKYLTGMLFQNGVERGLDRNTKFKINENNYLTYYELVKNVQIAKHNSEQTIAKMKSRKSAENTQNDDFSAFAGMFLDIIQKMYETDYYTEQKDLSGFDDTYYKSYLPLSKNMVGFFDGLRNDNFGGSILATIGFLNQLSPDEKNYKLIRDITFYGSFLTDMVMASTNENASVDQILNKYAMPVTSYRIKRHYKSSIDISAYPGLNFGYEFSNSKSPSFGLSAPIGFSFTWRSKNPDDIYAPSHSLFISAVDLGAPVSYRLTDDTASGLPEDIKWKQIFSPGLYYIYGFKNAPLCLSIGAQYTPLLRKIETETMLEEQNVFKAGISIMVDLPLFSLYKNTANLN